MAHRAKKHHQHHPQQYNQPQTQMSHYSNNQKTTSPGQGKLPRPLLPSVDSIYTHDKSSYRQGKLAFPPPQSLFLSLDNYDAGPDFLRPTSAMTFGNPKKSNFPLGVWLTPFGSQQVHKLRVHSPLRCTRCKAYANAYFRFDGIKSNAICNICGINFAIDQKVDKNNLNSTQLATEGVIDFVVQDKVFMKKRTDLVKILIAIEINSFMIESNALTTIINSAKAAIENTAFEKNIRIGVVIFNGEGVTYLKQSRSQSWNTKLPKKYTVKYSAQGLCCPLSDQEMLFNSNNQKQQLLYLLDCINAIAESQYKNSSYMTHGANYAVVLKSIMQNFVQEIGRVMIFSCTVPKSGPLAIRIRNEEDNKNPLKPLSQQYYELSKQLVKARIGVDMYLIAKQALISQQLATTHFLASHTGGSIYLYSPFVPEKQNFSNSSHSENLYYNIYGSLSRKYVYDVNFTARFSNGLNVVSFGIGDGIQETRDVSLGMFDLTHSVVVNFEQEEKIQQNSAAFIQFAIMFTNGEGERIIRILNYRYQITNKIEVIHEACDYLAVANILLRQATHKMLKGNSYRVREDINNRLIAMIAQYAQEGGSKVRISGLPVHPNLSPALAYIHSFINSKVLLNFLKISNDARIYQILKVNSYDFMSFSNYFYPKLFSLGMEIYQETPTPGDIIQGQSDIQQSVILPPSLPLTAQSISKDGVYLNWSPEYLLILVQPYVSSQLLNEIFGTNNLDEIQSLNALPELQIAHNIRINMIIEQLRRRTSRCNGIFLPLVCRTSKKKGPFQDLWQLVLKQDYLQCKYSTLIDILQRQVQTRLR